MSQPHFDATILSSTDFKLAEKYLGGGMRIWAPDLVISPDGNPYLYRWHLTEHKLPAQVYFHIQVADDPARPLHNHPWDNMSVILSGGYKETLSCFEGRPTQISTSVFIRSKGDVIYRRSGQAHRLEMQYGVPYTMTLFSTGPKVRDWGFWYPDGFRRYEEVTTTVDGVSVHINKEGM